MSGPSVAFRFALASISVTAGSLKTLRFHGHGWQFEDSQVSAVEGAVVMIADWRSHFESCGPMPSDV